MVPRSDLERADYISRIVDIDDWQITNLCFAYREKLWGLLAKVTQPTDWVNSLVCVTKSTGALRLCLDPKDLNCAVKRPHYFTPTLEDILPKLNGAKCFSILDARSGYWNIKLNQKSSLCTLFPSLSSL